MGFIRSVVLERSSLSCRCIDSQGSYMYVSKCISVHRAESELFVDHYRNKALRLSPAWLVAPAAVICWMQFQHGAPCVLSGGTGALGQLVATWMVRRGANSPSSPLS